MEPRLSSIERRNGRRFGWYSDPKEGRSKWELIEPTKIDRSIPTQKGANSVEIDRPNANAVKGQPSQEAIGQDRSGQGLSRPNRRCSRTIHNIRLKPVSVRSGRESNRRTCSVDEGRAVGSMTLFGRSTTTDQGRRCEHRIWWVGCSRWFEDM